jgi:hypothetical protein
MHRFLLLVSAGVIASGAAFADDPSRHGNFHLHGTYAFTGTSACLQDPASVGYNANLTPRGPAIFYEYAVTGTRTFNDDGTGIVNGTSLAVGAPPNAFASSSKFTFRFTYTLDSSGMLSLTMVPGSFSGQEPSGPRTGQTYVSTIPPLVGQLSEDARSIIISEPSPPAVESTNYSNGDTVALLCNRSRVLILTSHNRP